jgi:hypothetical protein
MFTSIYGNLFPLLLYIYTLELQCSFMLFVTPNTKTFGRQNSKGLQNAQVANKRLISATICVF